MNAILKNSQAYKLRERQQALLKDLILQAFRIGGRYATYEGKQAHIIIGELIKTAGDVCRNPVEIDDEYTVCEELRADMMEFLNGLKENTQEGY